MPETGGGLPLIRVTTPGSSKHGSSDNLHGMHAAAAAAATTTPTSPSAAAATAALSATAATGIGAVAEVRAPFHTLMTAFALCSNATIDASTGDVTGSPTEVRVGVL